jgi:hypothetical protein
MKYTSDLSFQVASIDHQRRANMAPSRRDASGKRRLSRLRSVYFLDFVADIA